MPRLLLFTIAIVSMMVLHPAGLDAQSAKCRPSVRATVGMLQPYMDEPWQFIGGGSVRVCVTGRLSVEPEVAVSPGSEYSRWYVVPNVLFDLRKPGSNVMPYAIGGLGFGRESQEGVDWQRSYMAWYGGIGVRLKVNDRVFVASEFRLGDDEGRVVVGVGYQFGGT